LVQVWKQAMADRFAYIPLIGIFIMIAWGLDDWAEARRVSTVWRVVPVLCVLMALGFVTLRQITYWESQYDLWARSLAVAENPFAHNALASALIVPGAAMSQHDLQNFDTEPKRLDEARRHFERVLEQCRQQAQWGVDVCLPEMATALSNLGVMDRSQNRSEETLRHDYEEALKVDRQLEQHDPLGRYRSYLAGALINLAGLDLVQNRVDEGREHYEEALQVDRALLAQNLEPYLPDMAMAQANLGTIDQRQNRMDEARKNYEEALKTYQEMEQQNPGAFSPAIAGTLSNLGNLEGQQNRNEESRADYTEAMIIYQKLAQSDPRYAGDAARIEAILKELGGKRLSR
jgi:tetratricopeptide (TPR) repeat protein